MANVKITELTGLTANETASTDVLPVVDVSADATKKLAISDLHRSVPDGTLSAPGIAFQSDLNSGLYRSGTDAIALVTNGAARILIDATGNVTIPNDLTVQGATTFITGQTVLIEDKNIELGVVTTPTDVTADGGGITLKGATDKTIQWINSTGAWTFNQPVNVTGGEDILIKVESTDRYAHIELADNAATSRITTDGNTGTLRLRADTSDAVASSAIQLEIDGDTKMFIESSGRVGVGTDDPGGTLHVFEGDHGLSTPNTAANSVVCTSTTDNGISILSGADSYGSIFFGDSSDNFIGGFRYNHDTDMLLMYAGNSDQMVINSSGDVGIGNTAPNINSWNKAITLEGSSNCAYELSDNGTLAAAFALQGDDRIELINFRSGPLTFKTTNTERFRVDSDGNLLIGGTLPSSPNTTLNADGSATFAGNVEIGDHDTTSTSGVGVRIAKGGSYSAIATQASSTASDTTYAYRAYKGTSKNFEVNVDGSATFAGNVGIGTSSPDGPLHVMRASAGTVTANGNADELVIENSGAGGISILTPDANHGYLIFGSPTSNEGAILRYRDSDNIFTIGTEDVDGSILFRSGAGSSAMTIDSSQRVGVGTTNPQSKIHVFSGQSSVAVTPVITLDWNSSTARNNFIGLSDADELVLASDESNVGTNSAMLFRVDADERMRIDSNGNVGIGTTSADSRLRISDGTNINIRMGQLALSNFTNPGAGIQFSRTSSDSSLMAIGVAKVDELGLFSREGIVFATGGSSLYSATSEAARIDSSGRLLVGTTSSVRSGLLEIAKNTADTQIQITESSDSGDGPQLRFTRTRNSNLSSPTPVQDNNFLGTIRFDSYDTAAYRTGAEITAKADGQTWASGDCPTRLVFSTTADGASSPTPRMMINSSGTVLFGGTSTADNDHANIDANGTLTVRRTNATDTCISVKEGSTTSYRVYADGFVANYNVGSLAFTAYDAESAAANNSAYVSIGSFSGEARITGGHSGTGGTPLVFRTASSGTETEEMRLLPGGGLAFNGDTAQANALDDYEEGTWTPASSQIGTYTSTGRYTKIGRVVYFEGGVTRTGGTASSASIQITGLPETAASIASITTGNYWVDEGGPSTNNGDILGSTYVTGTSVYLVQPTRPNSQAPNRYVLGTDLTSSRSISFFGWYVV